MKFKTFFRPNIMFIMMTLFIVSSCNKNDDLPTPQLKNDNLSTNDNLSQGEITDRDKPPTSKTTCNCSYVIDCIEWEGTTSLPNAEIDLYSTSNGVGGSCGNLFTGYANSDPNCNTTMGSCGTSGTCCDHWPSIPPTSTYPFKNLVAKFSTFNVTGGGIATGSGCNTGYLDNWRITYRITCGASDEGCTYTSDPITYTGSGSTNFIARNIQLGGDCGCRPTLTQPTVCDPAANKGGYFSGTYTGTQYYTYPVETFFACPGSTVKVFGDPVGVPNRFTIRKNGVIIDGIWVGDYQTYPNGPWGGGPIPYYYNFTFPADVQDPDCDTYTLTVETVGQPNTTDAWNASVTVF